MTSKQELQKSWVLEETGRRLGALAQNWLHVLALRGEQPQLNGHTSLHGFLIVSFPRAPCWGTASHGDPAKLTLFPLALFREGLGGPWPGQQPVWAERETLQIRVEDFCPRADSFTASHPSEGLEKAFLQLLYNPGNDDLFTPWSVGLLGFWGVVYTMLFSCLSETACSDSFPAPISLKNILEPNISLTISIHISVLKPTTASFWVVFKFEFPGEPWDFLWIPTPCSHPSDENCILNIIYKVSISIIRPKIHSKLEMQWLITTEDDGYKKKKKTWHIQKFNLKEIQYKRQGDRKNHKQNVPAWWNRE